VTNWRFPGETFKIMERRFLNYLRGVFGFIGITDLDFISADGVQISPEHREWALANALEQAKKLKAA
jgi:FMN-dependent NADH-azoreductase